MTPGDALIEKARVFSEFAHSTQVRKYTGEPYAVHPAAVAALVRLVPHTPEMVAAAYLHDVVEDTVYVSEDIHNLFGYKVGDLVDWLTDVSNPKDGNRAFRKAKDRAHIARAPADAKTIKLADMIDNAKDIQANDPDFARQYMREKRLLLGEALAAGAPALYIMAADIVAAYFKENPEC